MHTRHHEAAVGSQSEAAAKQVASVVDRACMGCGAPVRLPSERLSTTCDHCGSALVDGERARQCIAAVVPFRISRSVAEQQLRAHVAGHFWAPRGVQRAILDSRRLVGLLLPFWTYGGTVRGRYRARIGVHWLRAEVHRDARGKVRTRMVQETEWTDLVGTSVRQVEDHLVSASSVLTEADANALEPFDLGWSCPYDDRFLAGFSAVAPSIQASHADEVARQELQTRESASIVQEFLPGDVNRLHTFECDVALAHCETVLLPIWETHIDHHGRSIRLRVNGQTGACTGALPVSWAKVALALVIVASVIAMITMTAWMTSIASVGGGTP